jgi:hypothetical protein
MLDLGNMPRSTFPRHAENPRAALAPLEQVKCS